MKRASVLRKTHQCERFYSRGLSNRAKKRAVLIKDNSIVDKISCERSERHYCLGTMNAK